MAWMTVEERERVKAFVADPNGPVPRKARPASGAQRRRAPTSPRERAADRWATWFYRRMAESNSQDPAEHLPEALAELEQKLADTIRTELASAQKKIAEPERAAASNSIVAWKLDRAYYRITPFLSNGQMGPPCDVRPLFEQLT